MLLGHLALLVFRLHDAALRAEVLQFTVEHLIFAEFALQRSVEEGNLDAGLQADLVEALLAVGEHPGIVALELVLQPFADHLIGAQQVGGGDALAVGRIGDDDALGLGLGEVLEVLLLNGDVTAQPGGLHVHHCRVHGLDVHVVAIDMVLELALHAVVIVYLVEEVGIEVGPLLEGILLAEQTRGHVLGDECRLDEQGARAAHGVDEVGIALPAAHQDHACREHFVERGLDALLAIASAVERLTAGVEAQCALVLSDVHVQTEVRVGHGDVGALASLLADLVHDGVLHLIRYELGMAELLGKHHGVYGERLVRPQIRCPVDFLDFLVDIIRALGFEMADGLQDPDSGV